MKGFDKISSHTLQAEPIDSLIQSKTTTANKNAVPALAFA